MTKEDIIRMASEAGFLTNKLGSYLISPYTFEDQDLFEELERFAQLVAADATAKEREACAKVCDKASAVALPAYLGMQIRARGETTLRGQQ